MTERRYMSFNDDLQSLSDIKRIAELEEQLKATQAEWISDYKNMEDEALTQLKRDIAVKAVEGAFNYLREAVNNSIDNGFIQNGMAVHEILDDIGAQYLLCLESGEVMRVKQ